MLRTMHSVSIELLKSENNSHSSKAKATLMLILSKQNAWFQILHFESCFSKGPAAVGRAMGPSLKLEVDLRNKKS